MYGEAGERQNPECVFIVHLIKRALLPYICPGWRKNTSVAPRLRELFSAVPALGQRAVIPQPSPIGLGTHVPKSGGLKGRDTGCIHELRRNAGFQIGGVLPDPWFAPLARWPVNPRRPPVTAGRPLYVTEGCKHMNAWISFAPFVAGVDRTQHSLRGEIPLALGWFLRITPGCD
jgi:hypothetical protein